MCSSRSFLSKPRISKRNQIVHAVLRVFCNFGIRVYGIGVRSAVFVFVGTHLHIGSTVVILILGIVRTAFDTNINYFAKMSTYIVTKHFYAESVTRFSASK